MPNISVKTNRIALSDCFGIFAEKQQWLAFKEVEVPIDETLDKLGIALGAAFDGVFGNDEEKEKASQDMDSLKGAGAKYRPVRDARDALENDILQKLKAGKLQAFGHSLPRGAQDIKVQIPYDIWINYPSIKWEHNIVKGQGLEFINVVVSDQPIEQAQHTKVESTKKQGRPSVRPNILEAYTALRDTDSIDFAGPQSALFGPICDWLANRYPDEKTKYKGLENSTIRKAITKPFNEDRSKQP